MKENEKESEIQFKPLSDGLGFHPFSDGLPYAPNVKKSKTRPQGTGAVSAGPARFATSIPAVRASAAAAAAHSSPMPRPLTPPPIAQKIIPTAAKPTFTQSQQETPAVLVPLVRFNFLYSCKRILAFTFDTLVHFILSACAFLGVYWGLRSNSNLSFDLIVVAGMMFIFLNWAFITAQEVVFHTTLGKRMFGLSIPGTTGSLLLRSIIFPLGLLFFGLGVIWSLFDPKKRCWHDILSGTQPFETAQL